MNGYTETGKTKDGKPVYKRNDEGGRTAYITVNGHPRIARVCGMVCGRGMAHRLNHAELVD